MIDKLKLDVLVFYSNPCFHQNKTTTANKGAILQKQNQNHIVRTRKSIQQKVHESQTIEP
jgi:hypothetical protein